MTARHTCRFLRSFTAGMALLCASVIVLAVVGGFA